MTPVVHFAIPGDLSTLTGGYGYDRRILVEFAARGIDCRVLTLPSGFPLPSQSDLRRVDEMFAALPDDSLLIVDGLAMGTLDNCAEKHAPRLRLVTLCHHPLAMESGISASRAEALHKSERRALRVCRAVIVTSAATKALLIQDYAVPAENIIVALPGADRRPFAVCTGHPPCLLTVATLTPRKGHDVLISALADIRHLAWSARFVGGSDFDPVWAAKLQEKVIAHGLQQRIEFVGASVAADAEYAQADLFVLPSHYEGYGMVLAEAIACGLPVIATQVGAAADIVPAEAGMLVPPGNPLALADALRQVLCDDQRRRDLQQGARNAAALLPQWKQSADIIIERLLQVTTT